MAVQEVPFRDRLPVIGGVSPGPTRGGFAAAVMLLLLAGSVAQSVAGTDSTTAVTHEAPLAATGLSADDFHAPDGQLRALLDLLLSENPAITSVWARSRSRFERVPQAKSLPDPQLRYRYFARTPETRVGPTVQDLELSQGLPWSGKRRLQAERAQLEATGNTWEAEALERSLVAELKQAFFEAAYLQEALTIHREEQELLRRFEGIALKRYATGQGIQQSVIKVQTDISRLDDRQSELRQVLDAHTRRIAELIGRPQSGLVLHPIVLTIPDVEYDRTSLEQAAITAHPEIRAVESRILADRSWTKRRRLDTRPDFRVGVGYVQVDRRQDPAGIAVPPQDNGKDVVALSVGLNIPLFGKRNRAGVTEAEQSARANEDLLDAVRNRLRFEIQEATLRLETIDERSRLYREVIIPQAEESLASAEAAYTTNRQSFLDLLDAERIVFQVRLAYHRLVADYWIAVSELERAIAQPLPAPPAGTAERAGRGETKGAAS